MSFDPVTSNFRLVFNVNTDISQPTIVYINEELNYPKGCDISVTPANSLTWKSTEQNYYEFVPSTSTKNGTVVAIFIKQKTLSWYYRLWNWIKMKIFS